MASARVTVYSEQAIREAVRLSTPDRERIAHEIAGDAVASAPVLTGEYRDGIHAEVSGDEVRVVDSDPEAIHKEYGTSDTPAHAVLTDAARKRGQYTGTQPGRR